MMLMLKSLILLALLAGALAILPTALAQKDDSAAQPALPQPQVAPGGADEEEGWAWELGYQVIPDDGSWNQGPWDGDFALEGRPDLKSGSPDDQWWGWLPSDERLGPEEPGRTSLGGDPAAIPGPGVSPGQEPRRSKPDQFSGQAWGYMGDEEGAVAPERYSYDENFWSDTGRYDNETAFVDWWDS